MRLRFSSALAAVMVVSLAAVLPVSSASASGRVGVRAGELEIRGAIVISSNAEFTADNGVRTGKGTASRPFVISGWSVPDLIIRNTSAHVVVRDNAVTEQLVLDFSGTSMNVHHNTVHDLRVNQNVARTGHATGGRIHHNVFDVVGQLRHWGGTFEKNVIGNEALLNQDPTRKATQLDGFQRGRFRNNEVFGYVDVKLHGHYHGSSYKGASHSHQPDYEVDEYGIPVGTHGDEHVKRYNEGFVTGNTIHSGNTYGLRYYDRNHDGDDRTANSETDKFLNGPHVHFTKIHLNNNRIFGASLMVDVFNPRNDNHWGNAKGLAEIRNNEIELGDDATEALGDGRHGIVVQEARFLKVQIVGNKVIGPRLLGEIDSAGVEKELYKGAGIRLHKIEDADVFVTGNSVSNRQYGVFATDFHTSVQWTIRGLITDNVKEDVYYERVPNAPRGRN